MTEDSQLPDPHSTLEGSVAEMTTPEHCRKAVDLAFDYRGDVTIETSERRLEGYIYDRDHDAQTPYIRVLPADGSPRVTIALRDIKSITFSGKDTAAGKSWETWMKKWKEKKLEELAERENDG